MRWRRFAVASGILAVSVLAGWWWQGQVRQREVWGLVRKALRFQEKWVVTGDARWSFRDGQGRWVERKGRIAFARQALQVQTAGTELICCLSGCQVIAKSPSPLRVVPVRAQQLAHVPDRWALLRRSYRVKPEEPAEIAGHFVQWVRLTPRSSGAFLRRLAVEPRTGMVLAQEVLDRDGTVLSRWEWVKVSGKYHSHFRLPTVVAQSGNREPIKAIGEWQVDGFAPVQWVTSRCECCSCGMTVRAVHATDGAADVVLYLPVGAPHEHGCPHCRLIPRGPQTIRLGAVSVLVLRRPRPLVVVGDAPPETLLRIAQQVTR